MNNNETLFDKAIQNLNCAKIIYNSDLIEDEAYLNYVGYHLQQAVELAIKNELELNGIEYNKTHDIEQLIELANEYDIDLKITNYIDDKAEMFSSWEAKTRYIKNYKLEKRKVSRAIVEVEKFIDDIIKQETLTQDNKKNMQDNSNSRYIDRDITEDLFE